jgi:MinD-like ATPase involved in chromosome partitioning or flagellar assembly
MYRNSSEENPLTADMIVGAIQNEDNELAHKISRLCDAFHPRFIFNMGEKPDNLNVIEAIDRAIQMNLSIEAEYFGFIYKDQNVDLCINNKKIYVEQFPDGVTAKSIENIARRLVKYNDNHVPDSLNLLIADTFEKHKLLTTELVNN